VLILPRFSYGQSSPEKDTLQEEVKVKTTKVSFSGHSPHKATLYSMIIPGLGQAYNHKYWKIPIIYAGFGTLFYFISFNDKEYKKYREAYYHSLINDGTEPPVNDYEEMYDSDFLLDAKNYYRRNRDLSYIISAVWYMLNVADAAVDAHLFTWEVDDDLSIGWEPVLYNGPSGLEPSAGISFYIRY
jgi:hypothetical protein